MSDFVRVAAVGDVHLDADVLGRYRPALEHLGDKADMLLLAGDLTRHGTPDEAHCVAREFGDLAVPVIAILGNHDYHSDQQDEVAKILEDAGLIVLECSGTVLSCNGLRVGVAGTKGFGGGFAGACASEFGEPEMKAFTSHGRELAERFGHALAALDCEVRISLTHYAPVPETLLGEPLEIYPFLGSYQLAQAIDGAPGVGLAVHGHAHAGSERGTTPGGVPVRNVAHPVIKQAYNVYQLPSVLAPV
ncbi:metallophosphoesterase [Dactylosporangium sucinum]|uniref:Metallophosphoesterase n=1 Tax=Dactylosporangium sucinum TaxID=1424081 RepID=A0A917WZ41_9ACTN|nr:metallophosphoesterase [Dactylosporangium sucinum]GGM41862.1 metallophosphoesterase [Dactylosporangium sucinum]